MCEKELVLASSEGVPSIPSYKRGGGGIGEGGGGRGR